MMEGLHKMEDGDQVLPFVRCLHGSHRPTCGKIKATRRTSHKGREGNRETIAVRTGFSSSVERCSSKAE